jgi:hypothetical protein
MTPTISVSSKKAERTFGINALVITLFLFFIDEGYYSFSWMKDPGAWIVFLVYALVIYAAQLLIYKLVLRRYSSSLKIVWSILAGTTLGLLTLVYLIF